MASENIRKFQFPFYPSGPYFTPPVFMLPLRSSFYPSGLATLCPQINANFLSYAFCFFVIGSSVAPSSTNILLVAMTVASIMALVGVMYLGRKAMKVVNNPYNYEPLVVNK